MALSESQRQRIRVYSYLVERLDRKLDLFTFDDFITEEGRCRYNSLLIRKHTLNFKIKNLKNGDPENGFAFEFDIHYE
jgi:hypothetical protein